jgi:hypothetical protein
MIQLLLTAFLCLQDSNEKIDSLIRKLADPASRPDAMDKLIKIGAPALPALEKAISASDTDLQTLLKDVQQKIQWPGIGELGKIRQTESGEPRLQMEELEGAAYDRLRKLFPDYRIYKLTFSTLEGTFGRSDTYIIKRLSAELTATGKMSMAEKAEWLTRAFQAREIKLTTEAEVQDALTAAELFVAPIAIKADCIRGKPGCGGETVIKKVDGGWEYYNEICGEYATLHTIWAVETDKDGKVKKLIVHPQGKPFVLEKK